MYLVFNYFMASIQHLAKYILLATLLNLCGLHSVVFSYLKESGLCFTQLRMRLRIVIIINHFNINEVEYNHHLFISMMSYVFLFVYETSINVML